MKASSRFSRGDFSFRYLAVSAGIASTAISIAAPPTNVGAILLIGDSITHGQLTCQNPDVLVIETPWRYELKRRLESAGITANFVGYNQYNGRGELTGNCNEGLKQVASAINAADINFKHGAWCGQTTTQLLDAEKTHIAELSSSPDIIVLAAGFNDMFVENLTAQATFANTKSLIAYQLDRFPMSKVYVCTVIANSNPKSPTLSGSINLYNALLKGYIAGQTKVRLIDFNSVTSGSDTWDGTHPIDAQAVRMGRLAFNVITGINPFTP